MTAVTAASRIASVESAPRDMLTTAGSCRLLATQSTPAMTSEVLPAPSQAIQRTAGHALHLHHARFNNLEPMEPCNPCCLSAKLHQGHIQRLLKHLVCPRDTQRAQSEAQPTWHNGGIFCHAILQPSHNARDMCAVPKTVVCAIVAIDGMASNNA